MIITGAAKLKGYLKNKSLKTKISPQLLLYNYIHERFLERLALSPYKDNFILKGGVLIASMVGVHIRSTRDIDTSAKGFSVTKEHLNTIFNEICAADLDDNIQFSIYNIDYIREKFDYPGLRIHIIADNPPIKMPFTVDVTTGDKITPMEIDYNYKLQDDDKVIKLKSYNIETVLAEKLESIISRGSSNTRPRDFYDVHILNMLHRKKIRFKILKEALFNTATIKGSVILLPQYKDILTSIEEDKNMNRYWINYQKENYYAQNILFSEACKSSNEILDMARHIGITRKSDEQDVKKSFDDPDISY
jgi:predicted nucleotidyltransferase component of viral defense system